MSFKVNSCSVTDIYPLLGGEKCPEGKLVGIYSFKAETKLSDSFNKADLDVLVKEGKALGTLIPFNIESSNAEATYAEATTKERIKTSIGRVGYKFKFNEGVCFDNEIQKLDGSKWDVVFVMDNERVIARRNTDGTFSGFNASFFTELKGIRVTDEVVGVSIMMDLTAKGNTQWAGRNKVMLEATDFNFLELNPMAGVSIQMQEPLVAGSTIVATVSHLCSANPIEGIGTVSNFNLIVNGSGVALTAVTVDGTKYTFTNGTALVAGDEVAIETNDGTSKVITIDGNYYIGNSQTVTVA